MIGSLPHPTRVGRHANYDVEQLPAIVARWVDHYEANSARWTPRDELRATLWCLLHRIHTAQLRHIRNELARAHELIDEIESAEDEEHELLADQFWNEAAA